MAAGGASDPTRRRLNENKFSSHLVTGLLFTVLIPNECVSFVFYKAVCQPSIFF